MDKDRLLPWGYTNNGDELYWKTDLYLINWEIVVYESDLPKCYNYKMSIAEFLYKIVTREMVCDAFPDDFPSSDMKYITIDAEKGIINILI